MHTHIILKLGRAMKWWFNPRYINENAEGLSRGKKKHQLSSFSTLRAKASSRLCNFHRPSHPRLVVMYIYIYIFQIKLETGEPEIIIQSCIVQTKF